MARTVLHTLVQRSTMACESWEAVTHCLHRWGAASQRGAASSGSRCPGSWRSTPWTSPLLALPPPVQPPSAGTGAAQLAGLDQEASPEGSADLQGFLYPFQPSVMGLHASTVSFQALTPKQFETVSGTSGHHRVQETDCKVCAKQSAKHRPFSEIGLATLQGGWVQGVMPMRSRTYLRGWRGRLRRRC